MPTLVRERCLKSIRLLGSIRQVGTKREFVDQLLLFPLEHPYAKWTGAHWQLVEIADSGETVDRSRLQPGVDAELNWLLPGLDPRRTLHIAGRARRHGSIEGNAV